MSMVKVRERGQITLPPEIVDAANLKAGDCLEVQVENGKLVMTLSETSLSKRKVTFSEMFGAGPGVFGSPEEADAFIAAGRAPRT